MFAVHHFFRWRFWEFIWTIKTNNDNNIVLFFIAFLWFTTFVIYSAQIYSIPFRSFSSDTD